MLTTGTDDYVRVKYESASVLDHILCHEECDVDPINLLERATPLHFAIQVENPENRASFVEQLLDAGADYTCVRFSTVTMVQIGDLDTGYRIKTATRHWTSFDPMIKMFFQRLVGFRQRQTSMRVISRVRPIIPAYSPSAYTTPDDDDDDGDGDVDDESD